MKIEKKKKSEKKYRGLYKFVQNGEVIYIGMSNSDVFKRINNHRKEDKFKTLWNRCEIFVCIVDDAKNKNFIKACETALIDQYCPALNQAEKPSFSSNVDFETIFELKFEPYQIVYKEYCIEREKNYLKNKD